MTHFKSPWTLLSHVWKKFFYPSLNELPKGDACKRLAYRLFFQNILGFPWLKPIISEYFTHLCQKKPQNGPKILTKILTIARNLTFFAQFIVSVAKVKAESDR